MPIRRSSRRTFRLVLNAMARPGRIETVGAAEPPAALPAAGAVLLTLADRHADPPADADSGAVVARLHAGAPMSNTVLLPRTVGRPDGQYRAERQPIPTVGDAGRASSGSRKARHLSVRTGDRNSGTSASRCGVPRFQRGALPLGIDMIVTDGAQSGEARPPGTEG